MKTLRSHVGSGLLPCRRASNPLYGVTAFCPARLSRQSDDRRAGVFGEAVTKFNLLGSRSKDVKKIFEQIGFARVSSSAVEARQFRYPSDGDGISGSGTSARRRLDGSPGSILSEYHAAVGEKPAYVLSGGRLMGTPQVSEQYLLDLEREAFFSLCGRKETQARMQQMLKTGKPLRNLTYWSRQSLRSWLRPRWHCQECLTRP